MLLLHGGLRNVNIPGPETRGLRDSGGAGLRDYGGYLILMLMSVALGIVVAWMLLHKSE